MKKVVAGFALTTIVGIQSYSSKWAVKLATIFTATTLTGLLTISVFGFSHLGSKTAHENLLVTMENPSNSPGSYVLAFYAAYWSYVGIANAVNIVEEIKEPVVKNMIIGVTFSQIGVMIV